MKNKIFKSLMLVLLMTAGVGEAWGDNYIAGDERLIGKFWNVNADEGKMHGTPASVTFSGVPAGTYKFKVTDGSKCSGENLIVQTTSNAILTAFGDANNDGQMFITLASSADVTISMTGNGWQIKVAVEAAADYYLKHKGWGNMGADNWGWKRLEAVGDGRYYVDAVYNGTGCNWKASTTYLNASTWQSTITNPRSITSGQSCRFILNPSTGAITIDKLYTIGIDYLCGSTHIKAAGSVLNVGSQIAVPISAPEISGYAFERWTGGAGTTVTDPTSASTTVTTTEGAGLVCAYTAVCISPTIEWTTEPETAENVGTTKSCAAESDAGTVSYSSSDPTVASVNSSTGEIKYLKNGTTTITASVTGDGSSYCEETVSVQKTVTVNYPEIHIQHEWGNDKSANNWSFSNMSRDGNTYTYVINDFTIDVNRDEWIFKNSTEDAVVYNHDNASCGTGVKSNDSNTYKNFEFNEEIIPDGRYGTVTITLTLGDGTATVSATATSPTYTLTWNLNGGNITTPGTPAGEVESGTTLTAPIVEKTGYNFTSWSPAVPATMPSENATYTAQWTAKTTTITFNRQGATDGTTSNTATYGQPMQSITLPTRVGYTFLGYFDAATDGTQYYNADGTSTRNWNKEDVNCTLYAHWNRVYYYIEGRFVINDGASDVWVGNSSGGWNTDATAIQFELDEVNKVFKLETRKTPKQLETYHNSPWFFLKSSTSSLNLTNASELRPGSGGDLTASTRSEANGITVATTSGSNIIQFYGTNDESGYVTLYWNDVTKKMWYTVSQQSYTVTFDMNGKTGTAPDAQEVDGGAKATKPTDPTTEDGFTFVNWYTDAACTSLYDFNTTVSRDITLYAKWQINITWKLNFSNFGSPVEMGTFTNDSENPDQCYLFMRLTGDRRNPLYFTRTDKPNNWKVNNCWLAKLEYQIYQNGGEPQACFTWHTNEVGNKDYNVEGDPDGVYKVVIRYNTSDHEWYVKAFADDTHHIVDYDANSASRGTVPMDYNVYANGESVTTLANSGSLARDGYAFGGWNTAADGSGTTYAVSTSSAFNMGTENVVLYAKWDANPYNITYDPATATAAVNHFTYGGANPAQAGCGTSPSFVVNAAAGYKVTVTVKDAGENNVPFTRVGTTYTITSMPASNVTVHVEASIDNTSTTLYVLSKYNSNVQLWMWERSGGFELKDCVDGTENAVVMNYKGEVKVGSATRYLWEAAYTGTCKYIVYSGAGRIGNNKLTPDMDGTGYSNTSYYLDLKDVSTTANPGSVTVKSPYVPLNTTLEYLGAPMTAGNTYDLSSMLTISSTLKATSGATVEETWEAMLEGGDYATIADKKAWTPTSAGTYTIRVTTTVVKHGAELVETDTKECEVRVGAKTGLTIFVHNESTGAGWQNFIGNVTLRYKKVGEDEVKTLVMNPLPGFDKWYYYQFNTAGTVLNFVQFQSYTDHNDYPQNYSTTYEENLSTDMCFTVNGSQNNANVSMAWGDVCPEFTLGLNITTSSSVLGTPMVLKATTSGLKLADDNAVVYSLYVKNASDPDFILAETKTLTQSSTVDAASCQFTYTATTEEQYNFYVFATYTSTIGSYEAVSPTKNKTQSKPTLSVYIPNKNRIVAGSQFPIATTLSDYTGNPQLLVCYKFYMDKACSDPADGTITKPSGTEVKYVNGKISSEGTYYLKTTVSSACESEGGILLCTDIQEITVVADYLTLSIQGSVAAGAVVKLVGETGSASTESFDFTYKLVSAGDWKAITIVTPTSNADQAWVNFTLPSAPGNYNIRVTRNGISNTKTITITNPDYLISVNGGTEFFPMTQVHNDCYYYVSTFDHETTHVRWKKNGGTVNEVTSMTKNPSDLAAHAACAYFFTPSTGAWEARGESVAMYRVMSDYEDGKDAFFSNIVTETAPVSFYAQKLYPIFLTKLNLTTGAWDKLSTLDHSQIQANGIYVATLNIASPEKQSTLSNVAPYQDAIKVYGPAIVAAGVDMNQFTKLTASEYFDHYYCKWIESETNTAATVGNPINHNVSHGLYALNKSNTSIRYGYDTESNYFGRAFLDGTKNTGFLRLVGTGDGVQSTDNTKSFNDIDGTLNADAGYAGFKDNSDWVYSANVSIKVKGKIRLVGITGGSTKQYLMEKDPDDAATCTMFEVFGYYNDESHPEGDADKRLPFVVIYDFKTNRITYGWYPDNSITITENTEVDANLIVKRHEIADEAPQIFNLSTGKQVTIVRRIYTMIELDYTRIFANDGKSEAYADGLKSQLFPISVPYDVDITQVSGLPNYGTKWELQDYSGEIRAKKGLAIDYWTHLLMVKGNILKAERGYVLSHKFVKGDFKTDEGGKMFLLIPSEEKKDGYSIYEQSMYGSSNYKPLTCTISGHENIDSDWRVIGIPGFFQAQAESCDPATHWAVTPDKDGYPVYPEGKIEPEGAVSPNWIYEWMGDYGRFMAFDLTEKALKPTCCYMMQYSGSIKWTTGTNAYPAPAPARGLGIDAASQTDRYCLQMNDAAGDLQDQTYVVLNPYGSENYVMLADLEKYYTAAAPQVYSLTKGKRYAANDLPDTVKMVSLGVNLPEYGTYTFRLENTDQSRNVLLLDSVEQVYTNLSEGESYSFLADGSDMNDRFYLIFGRHIQPEITTAIGNSSMESVHVNTIDNRIQITGLPDDAELSLYDMLGRSLFLNVSAAENYTTPTLPTGVYHLLIQSGSESVVTKLVLR